MAPSVAAQTGASLGLPVLVLYHYFFCCRKLVHEGMYCFFLFFNLVLVHLVLVHLVLLSETSTSFWY